MSVEFRCPECGARVDDDGLVCPNGHRAARGVDGFLDFRRDRAGVDGELAAFWASSEEYYEIAGALNESYEPGSAHSVLLDELAGAGVVRLVDIGCGTGEFGLAASARLSPLEYVGVDVSPVAVRAAHRLARPGTFVAADAERLPFADGVFDAAISLYALEHFSQPQQVLREMVRVARPGGLVALLSISYDRPWGIVPSVRYGRSRRGARLGRWDPLNVAVYAARPGLFRARQFGKHLRYAIDPSYTSFEMVDCPIVLEGDYASDLDAVHVVSGRSVLRLLRSAGVEIVRSSVRDEPLRGFAVPFGLEIVGRKRG